MKDGIVKTVFNFLKNKCTDVDFICDTADKIRSGISVAKYVTSDTRSNSYTQYSVPENITKYKDLHERVMERVNSNKGKDYYKKSILDKKEIINVLDEAEKILNPTEYKLYEKYYVWFHGGNGKPRIDPDDQFKAIPKN